MTRKGFIQWKSSYDLGGRDAALDFLYENEVCAVELCMFWFNNECERIYEMARRNKQGNSSSGSQTRGDAWKGFININLMSDDKARIQRGVLSGDETLEIIRQMLAQGHKISLSHDKQRNSIAAAATGVREDCPNKGYTLTAFARDISDALTVLAFKHRIIAGDVWTSVSSVDEGDFG